MKKFIVLFFFLVLSFQGFSQRFAWGVTTGPNFGFISGKGFKGSTLTGSEALSGIHGGLVFQYNPRRFFTFFTAAEFVTKGANINSTKNAFTWGSASNKLRLNYLEIPLFIKLNLDPYSDIRPNIFAGPTLGFLISARDNFLLPQSARETIHPLYDTEENYKGFDPGIGVGAGLDIDMGDWLIFSMGMQYVRGFNNVIDTESVFVPKGAEFYNSNFRINFSLLFVIPTYTLNSNGKKDAGFNKFKKYVN